MRRAAFAILVGLILQVARPSPAYAWWGWIDELTGPKGFHGLQIDARMKCFGAPRTDLETALQALIVRDQQIQNLFVTYKTLIDRLPPASNDGLQKLRKVSGDYALIARQLIGTYITYDQLDKFFGAPALEIVRTQLDLNLDLEFLRLPNAAPNAAAGVGGPANVFAAFMSDLAQVGTLKNSTYVSLVPLPGVRVSLCKAKEDAERRASIDLGSRLFWATDSSPELEGAKEAYANGHKMWLFTAIPSVAVRPGYVRENGCISRDCQRWDWLDVVDASLGAGYYRLSSEGFKPLQGAIVEGHLDFHIPSSIRLASPWARAIPQFSIGRLGFVDGFDRNAFGPRLKGSKAESKNDDGIDWTTEFALFVDLGPLFK